MADRIFPNGIQDEALDSDLVFQGIDWDNFNERLAKAKEPKKMDEKKATKKFTPDGWEWELIEKGEIKNGMTQCGLLASWGKPTYLGRKVGRVQEWIYDKFLKHGTVYVKKGKIKKWEQ